MKPGSRERAPREGESAVEVPPGEERAILLSLSAALAAGAPEELRRVLQRAAAGHHASGVEEVILQSYLFLGYPAALNAFALWREISGRNAGEGESDDWDGWGRRGQEVCRVVYGGQYDGLRRNVRALHPDMERWMVVEGYGKVLGRPGLELVVRELCVVALLAVQGVPRQLYSHLRGALNAGASLQEVEEALNAAGRYVEGERRELAWGVWEQVRRRGVGKGGEAENRG